MHDFVCPAIGTSAEQSGCLAGFRCVGPILQDVAGLAVERAAVVGNRHWEPRINGARLDNRRKELAHAGQLI